MPTPNKSEPAAAASDRARASSAHLANAGRATAEGATAAGGGAEKKPLHIDPARLTLAEQTVNRWVAIIPSDMTPQDLELNPEPFALIAHLLHRGDDIRCIAANERRIIDVVVVHVAGTQAFCKVMSDMKVPSFSEVDKDRIPAGFEVVRATADDGQNGWIVRRLADAVVFNNGQPIHDRETAVRYLLDHAAVRGQVPQALNRLIYGS